MTSSPRTSSHRPRSPAAKSCAAVVMLAVTSITGLHPVDLRPRVELRFHNQAAEVNCPFMPSGSDPLHRDEPSRPARHGWAERLGRRFGKTIDATAGSLGRVFTGLHVPVFNKGKPGDAPGIELSDIAKLPTKGERVWLSCIDYSADHVQMQDDITDLEGFINGRRPDWSAVRWINVDGLSDMNIVLALATKYHLHPLSIEDLLHIPQRPKIDPYPSDGEFQARIFIVCRMIQLFENQLHSEQVSIFLGHKTVITFQESRGDVWNPIRQRINTKGSRLRMNDASFLAYALIDAIVDHCFPILEHYSDRLQEIEEEVLDKPGAETAANIHALNRELMLLRREVWPLRDVVLQLQREPHECMSQNTSIYLRDVYDHIVQIADQIETYRELAATMMETYATGMGNKLNEAVKVLTILSAMFTPPTFLASVYGMNFKHFPELSAPLAYPIFWLVCIGSSVGMLWWFKRRGWI